MINHRRKAHYFKGINFLRFLSAFAIIIYHCTINAQQGLDSPIKLGFHNLVIGVDVFFIISGFLITYLLISEKNQSGNISLIKFYMRRFLRIFPLYYLVVFASFFIFNKSHLQTDFTSHLFFLGNFSFIINDSWSLPTLNPLWSICIEEHFYLIVPLLVYLIPTKKLSYVLFSIIACSIVYRAYVTYTIEYNWLYVYLHTLSRCDVIAIGGLIAIGYNNNKLVFKFKDIHLVGFILLLAVLMVTLDGGDYTSVLNATFKKYLFIIPICGIFIAFVLPSQEQSFVITKIKKNSLFNYLGKISYGLYMYHNFVIFFFDDISFLNQAIGLRIFTVTIITIFISSISYELFEKKILLFKRRFEVLK